MADTQLELYMDDYIATNLRKGWYIKYWDVQANQWKNIPSGVLTPNVKYKLYVNANNSGTETYIKNVQIRVFNPTPAKIKLFSDDYVTEVTQVNSPIYSAVLKPRPTDNGSGDSTPFFVVSFMIKAGGNDGNYPIVRIGFYAEIVPQGHYWFDLTYFID